MRYDLILGTALSLDADDAGAQTAQWRQLVDLFVQSKGVLSAATRLAALGRIAALRSAVPIEQRRLAAMQLATRVGDDDSVALFGIDEPVVAAPVLSVVQLSADEWQALVPKLPPASRALLRNRRDLPAEAVRALASYGLSDFGLPTRAAEVEDAGTQIRDLVARIEAFRLGTEAIGPGAARVVDAFVFETSADGLFDFIAGTPREALIGLSVADIADPGGYGVDGQAAGAFRRRAPFHDARLAVPGAGAAAGDWLISAAPVFNPRDGRFAGYHGTARRPRADEVAGPTSRLAGADVGADSLRQILHELRTPLNAILGFAEMIDRQLLGPAALAYRAQAQAIVEDGQRLIEMVDDLDQAARARREIASPDTLVDAVAALERVHADLRPSLAARGAVLDIAGDAQVTAGGINPVILERMMMRLIGTALAFVQPGEALAVRLNETAAGRALFTVQRPAALAALDEATLLDPAYDPETPYPDAPLLGIGFTLRLVAGLAHDVGGRFDVTADAFVLTLPGTRALVDLPAGTPSG